MDDSEPDNLSRWLRSAVARYEGPLVRYAARITGDLERARDVVQDTFLRLCEQDPAELNGRLAPWLYTVCRRRALDVRRKEQRMQATESARLAERPADAADSSQTAEACELHQAALELLSELPEIQQEVVRLKFQDGLSYREIGEVAGLTVSNVGYLLHVALKSIRQRLQPRIGAAQEGAKS